MIIAVSDVSMRKTIESTDVDCSGPDLGLGPEDCRSRGVEIPGSDSTVRGSRTPSRQIEWYPAPKRR